MNIEKIRAIIEALIFASDEPVSLDALSRAVEEIDRQEVQAVVESLVTEYRSLGRPFHIVEVAGGWQFRTKPEFGPWLQRAHTDRPTKLSRASLETLSVIAYKQPITRPEVEDLRGVDSGAVLKNLLERNLIKIVGKKDAPGRPVVYGTTQRFLEVFSLRDLGSLPSLRDMTDLEEDEGQLSFAEVEGGEGEAEGPQREPEQVTDAERRRRIRDSVRGLLSSEEEGELPPEPDEEDDDALQELEHALERRREASERADAIFDESEREYIEKVTHPEMDEGEASEPAAEGGEVASDGPENEQAEPAADHAGEGETETIVAEEPSGMGDDLSDDDSSVDDDAADDDPVDDSLDDDDWGEDELDDEDVGETDEVGSGQVDEDAPDESAVDGGDASASTAGEDEPNDDFSRRGSDEFVEPSDEMEGSESDDDETPEPENT